MKLNSVMVEHESSASNLDELVADEDALGEIDPDVFGSPSKNRNPLSPRLSTSIKSTVSPSSDDEEAGAADRVKETRDKSETPCVDCVLFCSHWLLLTSHRPSTSEKEDSHISKATAEEESPSSSAEQQNGSDLGSSRQIKDVYVSAALSRSLY